MAYETVAAGTSVSEGEQHVTFFLNDEEYAVDAVHVQEIIELSTITRVPHLPSCLRGVINLRGSIIPVTDLKEKFGMKAGGARKHTCVIVTEFSGGVMGLIVDAVSDVLHMPAGSIAAAPAFGSGTRTDFIRGMGRMGERLVLILDMEKVLSDDEISALQTASGTDLTSVE